MDIMTIENPYPLPHDASEKTRLDTLHMGFKYYLAGKNIVPSLDPLITTQILDVGTGSGRWAVEVAEEFPNALVVGFDLAYPIFGNELPPANTVFVVGDVKDGFEFPNSSIDFVHCRLSPLINMSLKGRLFQAGLVNEQWPSYFEEVLRVLKPGTGWIQLTDPFNDPSSSVTGTLPLDSAFREVFLVKHRD